MPLVYAAQVLGAIGRPQALGQTGDLLLRVVEQDNEAQEARRRRAAAAAAGADKGAAAAPLLAKL